MNTHQFIQKTSRVFLLLVLLTSACAAHGPAPAGQIAQSNAARIENPKIPLGDQQTLSEDNRAFAVALYQKLRSQEGNLFFSPYSISLALAMTYAGARGATASQMAAAMHFSLPPNQLHPAFNALDQYLSALRGSPNGATPTPSNVEGGQGLQLSIANAIWGQKGFDFLPAYLDLLAQNYGAGMRLADFAGASEASRQAINNWVSQQTRDKIKDLFPQGTIDNSTRLALVNAIYFKASWLYNFTGATQDGPFHLLDGSQVTAPMMSSGHTATLYEKGSDFQAVGLPYYGGKTMMVVVLPAEGKFSSFEAGLDTARLEAILNGLEGNDVELTLPKFKLESSFSLPETLKDMGMADAFDGGQADFSGMDGRRDLFISAVIHKAYISVDEKGTEAAAATGVAMATGAMLNPPVVVVDRPFLFFIYDLGSGTILFAGRVMNPAS